MKLDFEQSQLIKHNGKWILSIVIPKWQYHLLDKLKTLIDKECIKLLEIKQKKDKRSLDANAALWVMLDKMAQKLHTSKDELYLEMLSRYGVFTHVIVKQEAVYRVKQEMRTVKELGKVTVNGQTGIQLQVYYGSSQYNTEEFSKLLDGVINDAKEIGIEFISKEDRNLMLQEWGVSK